MKNYIYKFFNNGKKYDIRLTELWDITYNAADKILDIRKKLNIITDEIREDKKLFYKTKYMLFSRALILHDYLTLADVPNGLKISSVFSKNQKTNVGMIFYKESINIFRQQIPWFNKLYDESIILLEDEKNVLVETELNVLAYTSNMIISMKDYKTIYERVENESNTRQFYSFIMFKRNN